MMRLMRLVLLAILLSGLAFPQWDRFRGPNGTGVSETGALPSTFGSKQNLVWRVELPPGHSSPIVNNGRIYLTGVENERLYTFCLDPETGRTLWKREGPRATRS